MNKNTQKNEGGKKPLPTYDGREKSPKLTTCDNFSQGQYLPDSGKFLIDKEHFEGVNIPENFTLIDAETGEKIDDFKKKSIQLPFKNGKIYISNLQKEIGRGNHINKIDKVLIYFSSKSCDNYFQGITKKDIHDILEHLKNKGFLMFSDIKKIYNEIYVKDFDIKRDRMLMRNNRDQIREYFKNLKDRFIGNPDEFHSFDSERQGFGIHCWKRETATPTKPFFKFYDKSKEIKKDMEFFNSLPEQTKNELLENFILRFEFTLKDKRHFKKYDISNRLDDIYNIPQEKLNDIAKDMLHSAFQKKDRKLKIDIEKLNIRERIFANIIMQLYQKNEYTKGQIMAIWTLSAKNKFEKYKAKKHFEKMWSITTTPKEYTSEMIKNIEMIGKWDRYFGLIK
ncbi:MAG: hypothetical protein ACK52I_37290 [Pseudomonadota bacterium]